MVLAEIEIHTRVQDTTTQVITVLMIQIMSNAVSLALFIVSLPDRQVLVITHQVISPIIVLGEHLTQAIIVQALLMYSAALNLLLLPLHHLLVVMPLPQLAQM